MKQGLKKRLFMLLTVAMVLSLAVVPALAAEGDSTGVTMDTAAITSALSTGLQQIVTQAISLLSMILPFAVAFFGTKWLCVKAMGWFKSMAK